MQQSPRRGPLAADANVARVDPGFTALFSGLEEQTRKRSHEETSLERVEDRVHRAFLSRDLERRSPTRRVGAGGLFRGGPEVGVPFHASAIRIFLER